MDTTRGAQQPVRDKGTLLFVDDEKHILQSLRRVFRKEPYSILTAGGGPEGLAVMKKNSVNVVVADHNMPKMTGIEMLKEARKVSPETICIMLTANNMPDVAREAIKEGEVYRFISKPWEAEEIKQIIKDAFVAYDLGITAKPKSQAAKKSLHSLRMTDYLKEELVTGGYITAEELERAIEIRKSSDENLGTLLVKLTYISEAKLIDFLSKKLQIPKVDFNTLTIHPDIIKLVPEKLARRYKLMPLAHTDKSVTIAMADPFDLISIGDIRAFTGREIKPVICSGKEILQAINRYYLSEIPEGPEDVPQPEGPASRVEETGGITGTGEQDLAEIARGPVVVALVNTIIGQAVGEGASDIHIDAEKKKMRIRLRIDGVLFEIKSQPKELCLPVVSRIKIMSSMDISKKWIPQDGRISVKIKGREIELRVSTYPTINGESVAMRILDKRHGLVDISALGFSKPDMEKFRSIIQKTQGIFLVTGPTGSGKTTTLYSAIRTLDSKRKNIVTIEEPVEYELSNINQGEIKEKRGFGFAHALRSILRHDPDIILVGEIRDLETAQIAFRAAMTGHFVFSTLHTRSAVGAVSRLLDLNVEPFLLSSSLEAVLGQRLVRKICSHCQEEYTPDPDIFERLDIPVEPGETFYRGRGCNECKGSGFKGRIGLFEIFQVNQEISKMIARNRPEFEIYEASLDAGMTPIKCDGLDKAKRGLTTIEEVMMVI